MAQISLEILSPQGSIYKGDVDEIILLTTQGEIAILPHHTSLFTKLVEGEIVLKKSGAKDVAIAVIGGFLEIGKDRTRILADYAIKTDDINIAKAEQAKKEAEKILKEKGENVDFALMEKQLQRSILELKVAEKPRRKHT